MKILKLSPRRWKQAFVKQHMDSDFMAASIQKDISLGGVEHLSKLHAFHCNYKQDINKDDDALVAETRLVNLLLTTKKVCCPVIFFLISFLSCISNHITLSGLIYCFDCLSSHPSPPYTHAHNNNNNNTKKQKNNLL